MIITSVIAFFIILKNIVIIVNSTSIEISSGTNNISRYELLHYLLNKTRYDSSIPPAYSSGGGCTDVSLQLEIQDVNSGNEQSMEFSSIMYIRMNWTDRRLDYSANATFPVLKLSGSYITRVWVPDIYFLQDREAHFQGFIRKNELVYIGINGSITYSGRLSTLLLCQMDLTFYPYDIQRCNITIQSYAYTKEDVLLQWKKEDPVMIINDNIKDNPQWRNSTVCSQCVESVGIFSTLNTGIEIKRTSHSLNQYISTPVVLVLIAMTSFLFGDNFTPRMTLSGASMTTIIMHWAGIYNKIQPSTALIWLDDWMLINLCFVGGIILFTAISYHFKHPKEIIEFKHLIAKSITMQLEPFKDNCPSWDEVKKWKSDKEIKQDEENENKSSTGERETLRVREATSPKKDLIWTIDRRFYAVKNDELREKYYKEFFAKKDKCWNFRICRKYTRSFILDLVAFVFIILIYVSFAIVYVYHWQNDHFSLADD